MSKKKNKAKNRRQQPREKVHEEVVSTNLDTTVGQKRQKELTVSETSTPPLKKDAEKEKTSEVSAANQAAPNVNPADLKIIRSQMELTNAIYRSGRLATLDLNPTTTIVLLGLSFHYNPGHATFFPSYTYLAKNCNVSRKSVERAIQTLKSKNILTVRTNKVNHYQFTDAFLTSVKLTPHQRQFDAHNQRQNDALTNKGEYKKNSDFAKKSSTGKKIPPATNQYYGPALPSAEETRRKMAEVLASREEGCSPRQYNRDRATRWFTEIGSVGITTDVGRFLEDKYNIVATLESVGQGEVIWDLILDHWFFPEDGSAPQLVGEIPEVIVCKDRHKHHKRRMEALRSSSCSAKTANTADSVSPQTRTSSEQSSVPTSEKSFSTSNEKSLSTQSSTDAPANQMTYNSAEKTSNPVGKESKIPPAREKAPIVPNTGLESICGVVEGLAASWAPVATTSEPMELTQAGERDYDAELDYYPDYDLCERDYEAEFDARFGYECPERL